MAIEAWPQRLAVTAPAGPADPDKLRAGIRLLTEAGCQVRTFPADLAERNGKAREMHRYLAACDTERAAAFTEAYLDPETDAVLCQRGGYGCARILPLLDHARLAAAPVKPVIGYSDVTALHAAMVRGGWGRPVIAPMAASLERALAEHGDYTFQAARRVFERRGFTVLPTPGAAPFQVLKSGTVSAPYFAGNLTVLASLCGTAYFPDLAGKILLLEDVGEAPYRLDRSLTQLALCGVLGSVAGLFFGTFSDCGDAGEVRNLLETFARPLPCPVLSGIPFGHTFPVGAWDLSARLTWDGQTLTQDL